MNFEQLTEAILALPAFKGKPPVLIDIGASGQIHTEWTAIAKHSVCIAFDADSRDFNNSENNSGYARLHLVNAIVSDKADDSTAFYLTSSPHCSSSLPPVTGELDHWSFSDLFKVEKTVELKNVSLGKTLSERNIDYVDWYKTDSQGIDLRLFKALPLQVQKNVLVAEFEPGFINAYEGEDKISGLLPYMETLPFWMSDCLVKGSQRISKDTLEKYHLPAGKLNLRNSACWAEFCYINTGEHFQSERELLLTLIFSCIKKQYGFALDLLVKLRNRIDPDLHEQAELLLLAELRALPEIPREGFLTRLKNAIR
jgi:hypothetical protein